MPVVSRKDRRRIIAYTALTLLVYGLVIATASRVVAHRWDLQPALALGLAFCGLQVLLVISLTSYLSVQKTLQQWRQRRQDRVEPEIRLLMAEYVSGAAQENKLSAMYAQYPKSLEDLLVEMLGHLTGEARQRVQQLGASLGLIEKWLSELRKGRVRDRVRAAYCLSLVDIQGTREGLLDSLNDRLSLIQTEAAEALLRDGERRAVEKVFLFSLTQPLLTRAVLSSSLRRHAELLSERVIPEVLKKEEFEIQFRCLQMVAAWEVGIVIEDIEELCRADEPSVREQAFRVAAQGAPLSVGTLEKGLSDPDAGVRAAAAAAAGRSRSFQLLTMLKAQLKNDEDEPAREAARAMARMGREGMEELEELVKESGPPVGSRALEALEKARIGAA